MRKVFVIGLSVVLIAGSVTSCKKTSKGKLSNDWKVTSWESIETETDANSVDVTTFNSTDGSAIVIQNTITPTGGASVTTSVNGTINEMTYTISKDGTFESVQDITYTTNFTGGSFVNTSKTTSKGTWNFLSSNKTEDFKKNERVVFHVLNESTTDTDIQTVSGTAQPAVVSTSNNSYVTGENSDIFVVIESKGKLLTLRTEISSTRSNTSSGVTTNGNNVGSLEFTLEQK